MNTRMPLPQTEDTGRPIVYVRPVAVNELPDEVRRELGDVERVYAIHHAEGERMALVTDRALAFVLARQNDLTPVSVH
ncbi:MAG: DUF1150 family protein [Rhodobacteraceae bacterium]|nr:DUF1150 family protein [Paracoccaceae bacterium]